MAKSRLSNRQRETPAGPAPALILIPDISGFTQFVSEVDISHSQHIIAELLEVIIDSNNIGLEVSEVEGDAVLFYRFGEGTNLEEVQKQAEKMFLDFHAHLQAYEAKRVCNCGACSTATKLGLKFIAHPGSISTMQIKDHLKLVGGDVILAHRLLKNDINSDEYLLVTDALKDEWKGNWETGQAEYEGLGEVSFHYMQLEELKSKVEPLPPDPGYKKTSDAIAVETEIEADIMETFALVADISQRPRWLEGLTKVEYEPHVLPKVGDAHVCVVGSREMEVATVAADWDDNEFEIVEVNYDVPVLKEVASVFGVKQLNGVSKVRLEAHPQNLNWFKKILWRIGRKNVSRNFERSLVKLKAIIESNREQQSSISIEEPTLA